MKNVGVGRILTDSSKHNFAFNFEQGSHRLQKYLNIHDGLEKSLKIKFALKST